MQSFFISIANGLSQIWEFFVGMFQAFFALCDYLGDSIKFVMSSLNRLPDFVRVPCSILLGVMILKFIISLGRQ